MKNEISIFFSFFFLNSHLGYFLSFIFVFLCHEGIPPPSRGKVGKNLSTRSKNTVRSKRVGPLGSNGAPLLGSHNDIFKWLLAFAWHVKFQLLVKEIIPPGFEHRTSHSTVRCFTICAISPHTDLVCLINPNLSVII